MMAVDDADFLDLQNQVAALKKRFDEIFNQEEYFFAQSDTSHGRALFVKADLDNTRELGLVGYTDINKNKLYHNSMVRVTGADLSAETFTGHLIGNADTTTQLKTARMITLDNDITGQVLFDGTSDVIMNVTINDNGVVAGEYGPETSKIMTIADTVTIPYIEVDSRGLITYITNQKITLPANTAIAGTVDSTQVTDLSKKYYLIGTKEQGSSKHTGSELKTYIYDHELYSNDVKVVNLSDPQSLTNKIYNGYILGDACEYAVDTTIGGTKDSIALVTSNALAMHTHLYAASEEIGGPATKVKLLDNTERNLVTGLKSDNMLAVDEEIKVLDHTIVAPGVYVKDAMHIPGGDIWIDESAHAISAADYITDGNRISAINVITTVFDEKTKSNYNVNDLIQIHGKHIVEDETNISDLQQKYKELDSVIDDMHIMVNKNDTIVANYSNQVNAIIIDNVAIHADINEMKIDMKELQAMSAANTKTVTEIKTEVLQAEDDIDVLKRDVMVDNLLFTLDVGDTQTYDITTTYGEDAIMSKHIWVVLMADVSEPGKFIDATKYTSIKLDEKHLYITNEDTVVHQFKLIVK